MSRSGDSAPEETKKCNSPKVRSHKTRGSPKVEGYVDLSHEQLQELPADYGQPPEVVKDIRLSHNSLTVINDEFLSLSRLRVLRLDHNKLETIPIALYKLPGLEVLNVSSNKISSFPDDVCFPKLRKFQCCRNRLQSLPSLRGCPKLRVLVLRYNQFDHFPECLFKNSVLRTLDLSHNEVTTIPNAVASIRNLHSLLLAHNKIDQVPVEIAGLLHLKELDLSFNELHSIPRAIYAISTLQKLTCEGNDGFVPPPLEELSGKLRLTVSADSVVDFSLEKSKSDGEAAKQNRSMSLTHPDGNEEEETSKSKTKIGRSLSARRIRNIFRKDDDSSPRGTSPRSSSSSNSSSPRRTISSPRFLKRSAPQSASAGNLQSSSMRKTRKSPRAESSGSSKKRSPRTDGPSRSKTSSPRADEPSRISKSSPHAESSNSKTKKGAVTEGRSSNLSNSGPSAVTGERSSNGELQQWDRLQNQPMVPVMFRESDDSSSGDERKRSEKRQVSNVAVLTNPEAEEEEPKTKRSAYRASTVREKKERPQKPSILNRSISALFKKKDRKGSWLNLGSSREAQQSEDASSSVDSAKVSKKTRAEVSKSGNRKPKEPVKEAKEVSNAIGEKESKEETNVQQETSRSGESSDTLPARDSNKPVMNRTSSNSSAELGALQEWEVAHKKSRVESASEDESEEIRQSESAGEYSDDDRGTTSDTEKGKDNKSRERSQTKEKAEKKKVERRRKTMLAYASKSERVVSPSSDFGPLPSSTTSKKGSRKKSIFGSKATVDKSGSADDEFLTSKAQTSSRSNFIGDLGAKSAKAPGKRATFLNILPPEDLEGVLIMHDDAGPLVKGATLKKLVELCTHNAGVDREMEDTLLTTYQEFCNDLELLNLLVDRYISCGDDIIQERVVGIMGRWLSRCCCLFFDEEGGESSIMVEVRMLLEKLSEHHRRHLSANIDRIARLRTSIDLAKPQNPPKPLLPLNLNAEMKLLDVPPIEWARQLCILSTKFYCRIEAQEFLNKKWQSEQQAPRVCHFIEHINKLSRWISSEIMQCPSSDERGKLITHCLAIATEALDLNNFGAAMAVYSSLSGASVQRLKSTWMHLGLKAWKAYNDIEKFMAPGSNYKHLREVTKAAPLPKIPYLGLYLQDLTFIDDGNPTYLPKAEAKCNNMINFVKMRMCESVINDLMEMKKSKYNLVDVAFIQDYIMNVNMMTDEELYDVSLKLEPRGSFKHKTKTRHKTLISADFARDSLPVALTGRTVREVFQSGGSSTSGKSMASMPSRSKQESPLQAPTVSSSDVPDRPTRMKPKKLDSSNFSLAVKSYQEDVIQPSTSPAKRRLKSPRKISNRVRSFSRDDIDVSPRTLQQIEETQTIQLPKVSRTPTHNPTLFEMLDHPKSPLMRPSSGSLPPPVAFDSEKFTMDIVCECLLDSVVEDLCDTEQVWEGLQSVIGNAVKMADRFVSQLIAEQTALVSLPLQGYVLDEPLFECLPAFEELVITHHVQNQVIKQHIIEVPEERTAPSVVEKENADQISSVNASAFLLKVLEEEAENTASSVDELIVCPPEALLPDLLLNNLVAEVGGMVWKMEMLSGDCISSHSKRAVVASQLLLQHDIGASSAVLSAVEQLLFAWVTEAAHDQGRR